jgi:hypothetical protein
MRARFYEDAGFALRMSTLAIHADFVIFTKPWKAGR